VSLFGPSVLCDQKQQTTKNGQQPRTGLSNVALSPHEHDAEKWTPLFGKTSCSTS
jgi:hypothetical protein